MEIVRFKSFDACSCHFAHTFNSMWGQGGQGKGFGKAAAWDMLSMMMGSYGLGRNGPSWGKHIYIYIYIKYISICQDLSLKGDHLVLHDRHPDPDY